MKAGEADPRSWSTWGGWGEGWEGGVREKGEGVRLESGLESGVKNRAREKIWRRYQTKHWKVNHSTDEKVNIKMKWRQECGWEALSKIWWMCRWPLECCRGPFFLKKIKGNQARSSLPLYFPLINYQSEELAPYLLGPYWVAAPKKWVTTLQNFYTNPF